MSAETIAKALGGRKAGNGWMARCPVDDDREASLSIHDAVDGKVLVRGPEPRWTPGIVEERFVEAADVMAAQ